MTASTGDPIKVLNNPVAMRGPASKRWILTGQPRRLPAPEVVHRLKDARPHLFPAQNVPWRSL